MQQESLPTDKPTLKEYEFTCPECGKQVKTYSPHKKFCGYNCRMQAWKKLSGGKTTLKDDA